MKNNEIIHGFNEDFEYDPIGNRIWSTTYNELGEPKTSEYVANNLNQYTSRTSLGYAAVRGFADAEAVVTVNDNPAYRHGEYFFGSDEFENSSSPVKATLETVAVKSGVTDDDPDEIASMTNGVFIAKSPIDYEYDDDGNQTLVTTKTGAWRVTYNGENRPVRWMRESDGLTILMSFDHQGRRRLYLETAVDGSTKRLDRFTYDNYLCIARNRWSPDGTSATDRFVWDPTEPVATRPLAFYQPNVSPQLYAHDGNKNVSELVSVNNGTITAHYEYSSFGDIILSSGDLALINPFRFSSEYSDDALGLVYYNYRHLEPVTGRWLSRDPIEEQGGLALYRFCGNNGVDLFDNLGNNPTIIVIEGVASLSAVEIASIAGLLCAGSTDCVEIAINGIKDILSSLVYVGKKIQCIRCKFGNHDAHHRFTRFRWGVPPWKYCWMKHLQLNCYIKGVKGTDRVLRLGYGPCYKNKYGKPNGETH